MADQIIPPLPPKGEIVSAAALYNTQIALYRNTLAFGGTRDPSVIWNSMWRDDGEAMLYYRELEEKDTDVGNALDTLKEAVMERDWSIQPADKSNSLAAEIAEFVKAQISNVSNIDNVLDNMLDAAGYGFSISELQFDTSAGQASLLDIKDCPQELFLFGERYQPQIGPLQFLTQPQACSGIVVPEEKFLVFSNRPRSRNRMGRPLLRQVFWSSWFKRNVQRLWLRYAEKGPGTAVVRYQDADNEQQKQQAAELAQAIIDQVAVGVPKNFEYDKDLLTIARSMTPDVYEKFYTAMQLDVTRRVLGETLTSFGSEKGAGSKGMGQTHSDTKETKAIRLCKATSSVLNRQLIRPMVLWNYGPNAPMPFWQFDVEEPEDLQYRIGIDQGVQRMGVPLTVSYLQEKYDVPVPAAGEVIAVPNVNAPQPAITEDTRATFSDDDPNARAAHAEIKELDKLIKQLRGDAVDLLEARVKEIASYVAPGVN